jgi:8-amino-7-oxononanoate synthase
MLTTTALSRRLRARLDDLRAAGLIRTPSPPCGADFSSNDYLKLSAHERVVGRMIAALAREGCGSTGSRLLRGERESVAAVERRFAAFKETERALYFSSGYQANLAVLSTIAERGDLILSDERNHASLIDGIRLSRAQCAVFPHRDVEAVEQLIHRHDGSGHVFIVTESLFSMDGDVAPLAAYAALAAAHGASLVVDEAHAVGLYGTRGGGLLEAAGLGGGGDESPVLLSINTAGKALGVSGAFVAGSALAIEYLVQRARPFVFSTAPPPALAAALDASLDVVAEEPQRRNRLARLSARLRSRLREAGLAIPDGGTQIVPVVIGDNRCAVQTADAMQALGFDVRAIRPPSVPPGTARLRVSVNVGLTDEVVDGFAEALSRLPGVRA